MSRRPRGLLLSAGIVTIVALMVAVAYADHLPGELACSEVEGVANCPSAQSSVHFTGGPAPRTSSRTATFRWTTTSANLRCVLDGQTSLQSLVSGCTSGKTYTRLSLGQHQLLVQSSDGYRSARSNNTYYRWTVTDDLDADGVIDKRDNCVEDANPAQLDGDGDGVGDACDRSDASAGPTLGKTVVAEVVSGVVLVDPPRGTTKGFLAVKGAEIIPIGSVVDVTRGRLALTSAASRRNGRTIRQRAQFYQGIFKIRQRRARRPTTELSLVSSKFRKICGSTTFSAKKRSTKVVSRLWGDGKGRFRTTGRHSSATVRGTKWLTEERCDGTLTRVSRGVVDVHDFGTRKTVAVRAGDQYLARAMRAAVKTRP